MDRALFLYHRKPFPDLCFICFRANNLASFFMLFVITLDPHFIFLYKNRLVHPPYLVAPRLGKWTGISARYQFTHLTKNMRSGIFFSPLYSSCVKCLLYFLIQKVATSQKTKEKKMVNPIASMNPHQHKHLQNV